METTYTVEAIKTQMLILKESLERRENLLNDMLDNNRHQRNRILPSDEDADEKYDDLLDEALELRTRRDNVCMQINNIANALLMQL